MAHQPQYETPGQKTVQKLVVALSSSELIT